MTNIDPREDPRNLDADLDPDAPLDSDVNDDLVDSADADERAAQEGVAGNDTEPLDDLR
jgi:hypothetical protein